MESLIYTLGFESEYFFINQFHETFTMNKIEINWLQISTDWYYLLKYVVYHIKFHHSSYNYTSENQENFYDRGTDPFNVVTFLKIPLKYF